MKTSMLQRMLARNRIYITDLQDYIQYCREAKSQADGYGDIDTEYFYHNKLKGARKELANMVSEQKAIKQLIKDN